MAALGWLSLCVAVISLCPVGLGEPLLEPRVQEKAFLKALGLRSRPQPSEPRPVPAQFWKMYHRRSRPLTQDDPTGAEPCRVDEMGVDGDTVRHLPDLGSPISGLGSQPWLCTRRRLYFNLSVLEEVEELTLAQLELSFPGEPYPLPGAAGETCTLSLWKVGGHPSSSPSLISSQSFQSLRVSLNFDLTDVSRAWRQHSGNLGAILEVGSSLTGSRRVPGLACARLGLALRASLLVVSLNREKCRASRRKRSSFQLPLAFSRVCKRRRLHIQFRDVGWQHWIIAPQGYMANYCHGECPYPLSESLNGTNHAILQTLVHATDPEDTPQPCCVPIKLSPISMLYYDNNDNVVLRHYDEMVVDECGCR
ncbi:protein DVR-1-like [Hemiscyllium ocellatum]|uniref:protein DVR-1-like n=1 Tax=Hemiscyllium ocellatum TaxID=170820 RepID=UPI002965FB0D|nr:protein DVR-1-like [Hemiscyllium ocellatum]